MAVASLFSKSDFSASIPSLKASYSFIFLTRKDRVSVTFLDQGFQDAVDPADTSANSLSQLLLGHFRALLQKAKHAEIRVLLQLFSLASHVRIFLVSQDLPMESLVACKGGDENSAHIKIALLIPIAARANKREIQNLKAFSFLRSL